MSEFEFRKKVSIGKISRSIVPKNSKISIRDYFIETESFRIFIRFLIRNVIFRKFSTSFSTKIFGVLVRFGDLVQWWVVLPICDVGNALMNTRLRENDVIELKRPVSHRFFDLGTNRSLLNKSTNRSRQNLIYTRNLFDFQIHFL